MADVKYIEIPTTFFEEVPISKITSHFGVDGNSIIVLYLHLLCASYKRKPLGVFSIADIELTDDVLLAVFEVDDIGAKLWYLERLGLIKREHTKILVFKFWQDKTVRDRTSPLYRNWRLDVFKRDGFRCQVCGTTKDIQSHHIKSWKNSKELRYSLDNGITLCRKCHLEAHGGNWRNG